MTTIFSRKDQSSVVFSPYPQSLINNLKSAQRKAASRFVCNYYYRYFSVSGMLQQLGWPTLECWWLEARATMMYKITTNDLVHVDQRQGVRNDLELYRWL